jgi:lipoprotein NlpD
MTQGSAMRRTRDRAASFRLLVLIVPALLLVGCGHSRVVRREGGPVPNAAATRTARVPASRAVTEPLPRSGVHVVERGETLYGISFRYGLRYQDVGAWNGIADPYLIEVGQRLRLRPGNGAIAAATPVRTPPRTVPRPSSPMPSASPPRAVGTRPPSPAMPVSPILTPSATTPPPVSTVPMPAAAGAPAWRWPTSGQVVGRYVAGDQTQQGINIAGNAGQDVLAAGDGIVVYSGAGLVGYGELIIIKHSDEWLSAYAHNRRRRVTEGTRVRAGDVIAEMGRTGASRDMLHFEIRRNGKPVDPLVFLPRR